MNFNTGLLHCVYWKIGHNTSANEHSVNGHWNETGCNFASRHREIVTCHCSHLTHFAVLLSPGTEGVSLRND